MSNITERLRKIKVFGENIVREWGIVIIILLVGLGSFGLGRLSTIEEARTPVKVVATETAEPREINPGGLLVASRAGSAYFYPWCSGASKILDSNKRWFKSEREAQAAGYVAAKNCKGLRNN